MTRFYVIYLSLMGDGNVLFSSLYSSFNKAKENIDSFLKDYGEKRSKKVITISKEELEALKLNKKPDDCIYVRRKNSEASLYFRNTLHGTFYNSYSIERYGKVGISEFSLPFIKDLEKFEEELEEFEETKTDEGVENLSHGVHVTFISELKNVLAKRKFLNPEIKKEVVKEVNPFILSLIEQKTRLTHITPPLPRRIILDDSDSFDSIV